MGGSDGTAIIVLTDLFEYRQLSVLCDSRYIFLFQQCRKSNDSYYSTLPQLLLKTMEPRSAQSMEMTINGIRKGEYSVVFLDKRTEAVSHIKASDAALVSFAVNVPLFIGDELYRMQTTPFKEGASTISIPCNVMNVEMLQKALDVAISKEDYEFASHIKTELDKRGSGKGRDPI